MAPSHIFPESTDAELSTETRTAYVGKDVAAGYSQPYRGSPAAFLASNSSMIAQQPGTIASQLQSLGERLGALAAPPAAPVATASEDPPAFPVPSSNDSYDSFAKYAAEASRVRNSGRLPFGSDTKKMAI